MKDVEFTSRREGVSPIFVGSYQRGDPIEQWEPAIGDVVTLRVDQIEVVVRIREATNRSYVGTVIGFENHDRADYRGLEVDGSALFAYRHIQSCMQ